MSVYLKQVQTGEVRQVDAESDEYFDLIDQVVDDGSGVSRPAWEQQGMHSAYNPHPELPESAGLASQGPELEPHKNLTQAEMEAGLESWDQKKQELDDQRVAEDEAAGSPEAVLPRKRAASAGQSEGSAEQDQSGDTDLNRLNRSQLNERASTAGVDNPEGMHSKQDVINAIRDRGSGGREPLDSSEELDTTQGGES